MTQFSVNSRIIIDTYAYNRFNPNRKVSLETFSVEQDSSDSELEIIDAVSQDASSQKFLSEEQLLICTSMLRGYALKEKEVAHVSNRRCKGEYLE